MTVRDIASNMERRNEPCTGDADDEKAGKVYFVHVFGIQKQVGYSEILSKVPGDHCKENDPAQHEHLVALEIVNQQLNGK